MLVGVPPPNASLVPIEERRADRHHAVVEPVVMGGDVADRGQVVHTTFQVVWLRAEGLCDCHLNPLGVLAGTSAGVEVSIEHRERAE